MRRDARITNLCVAEYEEFRPSFATNSAMRKVLIIGGDSDYNLGDAAILAALCAQFSRIGVHEITVTSALPNPRLPNGATAVLRRGTGGFASLLAAARRADLVVIGGGGLLQDDDSRVKMPYWASRVAALRLANPHIVGHSMGAGPLQHPESRIAARFICDSLASISVRDTFAQSALQGCSTRQVGVVPDPAFMLAPAEPGVAERFLASLGVGKDRPVIGLALRKWFHPRGGFLPSRVRIALGIDTDSGSAALQELLKRLAAAVAPMAAQMQASILLLPTYSAPYENDVEVCRRFATLLPDCDVRLACITDPALYKAVTGRLRVLISARMHPLILAAGMGTPIVGLAYNGKFEGMFDMLQMPRRMIWLKDSDGNLPSQLTSLVEAAMADDGLKARALRLAVMAAESTVALLGNSTIPAQAA